MNLLPGLYYATACITGMGTLMLGVSEDNYLLAALAVIVSIAALVLCDLRGWVRLDTWASNLASVAALLVALWRFNSLSSDEGVLAVADLMGYLQFIMQFRIKTVRNLWLLAVVSFLQVSVAAALHTSFTFAFLLTAYLFSGVFFLALFYLYREQLRQADAERTAEQAAAKQGFGFVARPSTEPVVSQMRRELSRKLAATALGTIVMAVFFFVAVPRIGQSNWVPTAIVAARAVGFSTEINLARSGEIAEDPEVVMQAKFFDAETDEPYQIDGEPYFRGTSLTYYNQGRWRGSGLRQRSAMPPPPPAGTREELGLVRQQIVVEPLSTTILFACAPWFSETADDRLTTGLHTNQLNRREGLRTARFSYSLLTSAFRNHRQNDVMAAPVLMHPDEINVMLRLPQASPAGDSIARLKSAAASVVANIPSNDVMRRAKALEAHLRDSGNFQYTLQSPQRPADVDPLEDFIANNTRGHCEYFAGALTLMLRSVGIPARIVVGYRGGEWNVVGSFYQVRQLNAHSWVEALLPAGSVPRDRFSNASQADVAEQNGAWLRLDPTTTIDVAATATGNSRWAEIQQVVDYFKFVWNNYVVGLDAVKQQESVYQPIIDTAVRSYRRLTDAKTWNGWYEDLWAPLKWTSFGSSSWPIWIASAFAMAGAIGIGRFLKSRLRRGMTSSPMSAEPRRRPPPIDFYVRLEQVLATCELRRTPEQTQREFVQAACGELAELPATRGVAALPRRIVEAFYRVRFGGRTLADGERNEVEQALSALAAALPAETRSDKSSMK